MSGNSLPIVVLVEPQLGENIGMCARAMLNCGIERLRLVRPRDGWPNSAAAAAAADADAVIDAAEVFATLAEALGDCHHVVATSARERSLALPVLPSGEATARIAEWTSAGSRVAVVFGPEASGLDNEAIAKAEFLMRFETNPAFSSLNLAQCVLLFGWEWRNAVSSDRVPVGAESEPANRRELDSFLDRLEVSLDSRGFYLTSELRPTTSKTVRSLFARAAPSEREIALLQGMLTALLRKPRER